jgi:hypothetical protein
MSDPNGVTENSAGELLLMLPALCSTENLDDGLGFYGRQNLFKRIIRNPTSYGRPPKERECAEMLCGCLIHMPLFRVGFLKMLAGRVGQDVDFDTLDLNFNTEQSVLGKRDDLRIEGYDSEQGTRRLIWTIELKVGAGFHYSTSLEDAKKGTDGSGENGASGGDVDMVHQVKNYDVWLSSKKGVHYKAGFVISIWNQKVNMPNEEELTNLWECLTWYDLGVELRSFLQGKNIPEIERFLGRHLLGFIERSLGGREMDNDLQLEDIAFFKSFYQQAEITKERISNLVADVASKFETTGPIGYPPERDEKIFDPHTLCTFAWRIGGKDYEDQWPCLCSGFTSHYPPCIIVYISTKSKHPDKAKIRNFIETQISDLKAKNENWNLVDREYSKYWDLELRAPMEILLGQKDQVEWMRKHFEKAFKDLEEAGIIKGIQDIVLRKTAEQGNTQA